MSGDTSLGFNSPQMSPELAQILSARQALRILDASIAKTETRLRRLPGLVAAGGVPGTGAPGVAPMPGRRTGPLTQAKNGTPFKLTTQGMVLNKSFFGKMGIPIAAFAAPAIAGAVFNQVSGVVEGFQEARAAGATRSEAVGQVALGAADALLAPGRMAVSGANRLLRAFGVGGLMSDSALENRMSLTRNFGFEAERRRASEVAAIRKAGEDVRKKFREAYEFLDGWTPADFEVADDATRSDLRRELRRINEGRLDAWMDDARNRAVNKAARDSSGD